MTGRCDNANSLLVYWNWLLERIESALEMETHRATSLLIDYANGRREAIDELLPIIYDESHVANLLSACAAPRRVAQRARLRIIS